MKLILGLALVFSVSSVLADTRCGGESGPKPLADISHSFQADVKGITTDGSPEEFLFSEKDNAVIYRNEYNKILRTTKLGPSIGIAESGLPLARLTSDKSRYLAADAAPWVFDRRYNRWHQYILDARPFRHLFFSSDSLYSISSKVDAGNNQIYQVFKYNVGEKEAYEVCRPLVSPPGEHLTLAEGHSYPFVYFYRVFNGPKGKRISFFRMDLGLLCDLKPITEYTRDITGPVKKAHIFKGLNEAFLVEVDHPTHNLLWDYKGCRYFHIDGQALVLNYNHPVISTWSDSAGLSMVYLEKENQAYLPPLPTLGYAPMRGLLQEDVWLADDGVRLFLAPRFDWGPRWLLQMTLSDSR